MLWSKFIFILVLLPIGLYGQEVDTTRLISKKKNLKIAAAGAGAAYGISLAVLNHVWYKNTPRQSFAFFNDNAEWKQVDKIGHFYSSFYVSLGTSKALQHYAVPVNTADWIGALTGFAVLVPIEIFDGFSETYGASVGDLIADGAGSLFYLGQKQLWSEVRIYPKFSFHSSPYARRRPDVLGAGAETVIKDYNGQTYWLTIDADKFVRFPRWLNLSIGYGAEGLIYARDGQQASEGYAPAYRQYYFSFDLDVNAIPTRSRAVKTILFFVNMLKIPAPTIELSNRNVKFHVLYF